MSAGPDVEAIPVAPRGKVSVGRPETTQGGCSGLINPFPIAVIRITQDASRAIGLQRAST